MVEPKILVVEDDPEALDMITSTLEQEGYHVVVASDGLEGMAVALSQSPQLIIADLKMPRMDGVEMVRRLRRQLSTRQTPIVAITAYPTELQENGLMAGANRVLVKPFNPDLLVSSLRTLLAEQ